MNTPRFDRLSLQERWALIAREMDDVDLSDALAGSEGLLESVHDLATVDNATLGAIVRGLVYRYMAPLIERDLMLAEDEREDEARQHRADAGRVESLASSLGVSGLFR
jgi:hypothetical protein